MLNLAVNGARVSYDSLGEAKDAARESGLGLAFWRETLTECAENGGMWNEFLNDLCQSGYEDVAERLDRTFPKGAPRHWLLVAVTLDGDDPWQAFLAEWNAQGDERILSAVSSPAFAPWLKQVQPRKHDLLVRVFGDDASKWPNDLLLKALKAEGTEAEIAEWKSVVEKRMGAKIGDERTIDLPGGGSMTFCEWEPERDDNLVCCKSCGNDESVSNVRVAYVAEVFEGSFAFVAGVLPGDILCEFGAFRLRDEPGDIDFGFGNHSCGFGAFLFRDGGCFSTLGHELEKLVTEKKRFVVARKFGDIYRVVSFNFPPGKMGVRIQDETIGCEVFDVIQQTYWGYLKVSALSETGAKMIRPCDEMTITLPGDVPMTFCWCPATTSEAWKKISGGDDFFWMGSPESEAARCDDETRHRVKLTQGFWMGKYEVTQRQWEGVMGKNPSHFRGADRPVEQVSWNDCQEFVEKINAAGQVRVSLPTEAQWEYACRAGTTTPYNFGSSLNGDKANCYGDNPYGTTVRGRYRGEIAPVGSYAPNAWGLCDMHGNVWEWCQDWYGSYTGDVTDPTGSASGTSRVYRGGSWSNGAQDCRSAFRRYLVPGYRFNYLGFRLVCSAGPHG